MVGEPACEAFMIGLSLRTIVVCLLRDGEPLAEPSFSGDLKVGELLVISVWMIFTSIV